MFKQWRNRVLNWAFRKAGVNSGVEAWAQVSDIELAARLLDTEFFKKEIRPEALPVEESKTFLVIAPHQDDEAIGAGGSLVRAAAAGSRIEVVYFTDGAQHNAPLPEEEWVQLRAEEARAACALFDGRIHELHVSNERPVVTREVLETFGHLIRTIKPHVLLIPWLLDVPTKHRLTNHALWLVHQLEPLPACMVWGYQVHNTLLPNGYVDVSETAETKREMLACYASQNNRYKRYDHIAMGLAAWNSRYLPRLEVRKPNRYAELFYVQPLSVYLDQIEHFYFTDLAQTYRGDRDLIQMIERMHLEVMGPEQG